MSPPAASQAQPTLPPPVERPTAPRGWFAVAEIAELPAGGVEPLVVFARELVLFRDEAGTPHALDAHCRHLGAHLGYGGQVDGDGIRCPFHGWRWGPDGVCTGIPYSKHVPKGARIGAWPVCERNGYVCVWYDPSGGQPAEPAPAVAAADDRDWGAAAHMRWKIGGWVDLQQLTLAGDSAVDLEALAPGLLRMQTPGGSTVACLHATPIDPGRTDIRLAVHQAANEPDAGAVGRIQDRAQTLVTILDNRRTTSAPPPVPG